MFSELTWRPWIDPLGILMLTAFLAGLAILVFRSQINLQRSLATGLLVSRLFVIIALSCILMGPSRSVTTATTTDRGSLTILLDISGSMLQADTPSGTRLDEVSQRWLTNDLQSSIREHSDIRFILFDRSTRPSLDLLPPDLREQASTLDGTNYLHALLETMRSMPGRGDHDLFLIGDGNDTLRRPLGEAVALARQRGSRIHTAAVGSSKPSMDVALLAYPRQESIRPNETGSVAVAIHHTGARGQTALVRLRSQGIDLKQEIRLGEDGQTLVEFPIRHSEVGDFEYRASVEPLPDETETGNNAQTLLVNVSNDRTRVLILEGEPYWDTKFIAQSLRGDSGLSVTYLARLSPARAGGVVSRSESEIETVPSTVDDFSHHDVVILGRRVENLLTPEAASALVEYVSRGVGHVLFARGRAYDPDTPAGRDVGERVRAIEPVVFEGGRVAGTDNDSLRLTDAGRTHPAFSFPGLPTDSESAVRSLPNILAAERVSSLKPATNVLATSGRDGSPAIVTMPYGSGQTFAILGEGLWRWSMLPDSLAQHRGLYDRFWSSAVRSLARSGEIDPGAEVSFRVSPGSTRLGEETAFDVLYRSNPPSGHTPLLRIQPPRGDPVVLPLRPAVGRESRFTASFIPETPGVWQATLDPGLGIPAPAPRRFSVIEVNLERLHSEARPEVLQQLAEETGGVYFNNFPETNPADYFRKQSSANVIPPRLEYVWDNPWLLAALLLALGAEWIARRWCAAA